MAVTVEESTSYTAGAPVALYHSLCSDHQITTYHYDRAAAEKCGCPRCDPSWTPSARVFLRLERDQAQALLDLIWWGVTGPDESRAQLLHAVADILRLDHGFAQGRQDFTGRVVFDDPDRLPGVDV